MNDSLTSYFLDPNAHPLTWPVLAALFALAALQGVKSHVIPWDPPAKWQPFLAAALAFVGAVVPMLLTSAQPLKALVSAALAAFLPQGMYSIGVRPTAATPPASVPPPGAP